ncbi:MAG TPA: hypothetical protein VGO07_05620 [Candidatus Saccharimonadales bacterium]|jgi:hypothetical protein|nr:hypothetical protein [Candidatus Saccharimonadales bacterium]
MDKYGYAEVSAALTAAKLRFSLHPGEGVFDEEPHRRFVDIRIPLNGSVGDVREALDRGRILQTRQRDSTPDGPLLAVTEVAPCVIDDNVTLAVTVEDLNNGVVNDSLAQLALEHEVQQLPEEVTVVV